MFGNVWQTAHIVPIDKKGRQEKAGNYSLVSLTCVFVKLIE